MLHLNTKQLIPTRQKLFLTPYIQSIEPLCSPPQYDPFRDPDKALSTPCLPPGARHAGFGRAREPGHVACRDPSFGLSGSRD